MNITNDYSDTGTIELQYVDSSGDLLPIAHLPLKFFPVDAGASAVDASGKSSEQPEKQAKRSSKASDDLSACRTPHEGLTNSDGRYQCQLKPGWWAICATAFGVERVDKVKVESGCTVQVRGEFNLAISADTLISSKDCSMTPCRDIRQGQSLLLRVFWNKSLGKDLEIAASATKGAISGESRIIDDENSSQYYKEFVYFAGGGSGPAVLTYRAMSNPHVEGHRDVNIFPDVQNISGNTTVTMTRTETSFTEDTAFWTAIRNSTDALSFNNYLSFMDWIFCGGKLPPPGFEANRFPVKDSEYRKLISKRFLSFTDSDSYRVIKAATEAFVMVNCGVLPHHGLGPIADLQPFDPDRDNAYLDRRDLPIPQNDLKEIFKDDYLVGVNGNGDVLPYLAVIRRKLPDIPIKSGTFEDAVPGRELDNCFGLLQEKLANPCLLELIWSYWHEEGMLVQTMNTLSRRFQNIRSSAQDPLANLEMDPLRPLNNLLWSYIQDEQHRLTINRRNYEYDHHYGLRLEGKAVQDFRPVDTRSKFLEAFHHLLRLCTVFYKQDDDTTVKADAFPVLNALKEVHLILSQGAHNQFGDLPSTSRIEMLMQQWLLARPEFRELLPTRIMVAYPEPWMDRVDAMKKLQGWTDTSVLHFRNLGMFGEQLLLSIRWGHWSDEFEPVKALNWARFFRPQAQGYIHAYRAATGVDLSADPTVNARVDSTLPSVLLQRRLASQQRVS